jgi:hypothetical protein
LHLPSRFQGKPVKAPPARAARHVLLSVEAPELPRVDPEPSWQVPCEWPHLFQPNTALIAVRRDAYLRNYAYRFIELCSPALREGVVKAGVMAERTVVAAEAKSEGAPRNAAYQGWRSSGNTLSREDVKRTA